MYFFFKLLVLVRTAAVTVVFSATMRHQHQKFLNPTPDFNRTKWHCRKLALIWMCCLQAVVNSLLSVWPWAWTSQGVELSDRLSCKCNIILLCLKFLLKTLIPTNLFLQMWQHSNSPFKFLFNSPKESGLQLVMYFNASQWFHCVLGLLFLLSHFQHYRSLFDYILICFIRKVHQPCFLCYLMSEYMRWCCTVTADKFPSHVFKDKIVCSSLRLRYLTVMSPRIHKLSRQFSP